MPGCVCRKWTKISLRNRCWKEERGPCARLLTSILLLEVEGCLVVFPSRISVIWRAQENESLPGIALRRFP